tara:strand:- start:16227 stop:17225 length:999 start_codon:yes stop_codon:yes gene_type:complete
MRKNIWTIAVVFCLFISNNLRAQGDLTELAEKNAKSYIQPFITAFGMNMNSGLTHTAKVHKVLGFDISLKVMMDMIPDDELTFNFDLTGFDFHYTNPLDSSIIIIPASVLYPDDNSMPTIFGGTGTLTPNAANAVAYLEEDIGEGVVNPDSLNLDDLHISFSGIDFSVLPMFRPQISLGLPMNSELLLSYMSFASDDFDNGSFLSLGLKHSLDQYIPMPTPFLNLAAQGIYQKLELGVITSTHTHFNLQASADFPIISIYGLLGMDKSNLEASYTIEEGIFEGEKIGFSLDGENAFRSTIGAKLKLALLYLSVDYTIGKHNAITIGTGVTLR